MVYKRRLCTTCNLDIITTGWKAHLNCRRHKNNESGFVFPNSKKCETCHVFITKKNWSRHVKGKRHLWVLSEMIDEEWNREE